jgi:hypothetical protein
MILFDVQLRVQLMYICELPEAWYLQMIANDISN